jgi:hypothetical protein
MKLNDLTKAAVLGLAIFVATGAFAANKATVHVDEAVEVNGQQLAAGDYQLRWEGTGSNVEVSFLKGKKEIAKTSAKEVDLGTASAYDSAVIDHSNGKALVSEIRFAGKKMALSLNSSDRAAMGGSSN